MIATGYRISSTGNKANETLRLKRTGIIIKNANGNRIGNWIAIRIFCYVFSLDALISTAYEGNAFALTPHPLLDFHFFLLLFLISRVNEYQQLIFLILFGLAFKQPAQDAKLSQTRYSFVTIGDE